MIPVISPDTKVLTKEHIEANEILIVDHMPPYNPQTEQVNTSPFKNTIIELFRQKSIDYREKTFYTDSYFLFDDFPNLKIHRTHFFTDEIKKFKKKFPEWDVVPTFDTTCSLTFMSNKSRPHRDLCSLILEGWRKQSLRFKYSYNSGPQSLPRAIELLTDVDLITDKLLDDTFFGNSVEFKKWSFGGIQTTSSNAQNFTYLYSNIFENCAVGIITEPNLYERGNMFSEKTLMSIYAGQFLIWPGSYKMAETAKKLGIDIFGEFIDHSYQYIEDPGQRVIDALVKNKDLLFDIDRLDRLRKENVDRLNANLKSVRDSETFYRSLNNLHTINT